jgi:hypothetical protein
MDHNRNNNSKDLYTGMSNDMRISIDQECKLFLHADDSAILYAHKNPSIISQKTWTNTRGVFILACR